jgi:hypothetical protein
MSPKRLNTDEFNFKKVQEYTKKFVKHFCRSFTERLDCRGICFSHCRNIFYRDRLRQKNVARSNLQIFYAERNMKVSLKKNWNKCKKKNLTVFIKSTKLYFPPRHLCVFAARSSFIINIPQLRLERESIADNETQSAPLRRLLGGANCQHLPCLVNSTTFMSS